MVEWVWRRKKERRWRERKKKPGRRRERKKKKTRWCWSGSKEERKKEFFFLKKKKRRKKEEEEEEKKRPLVVEWSKEERKTERRRRREKAKWYEWIDSDESRKWVPRIWFLYKFATITHIPWFENTKNLFLVFIIQTQFFEFWVLETILKFFLIFNFWCSGNWVGLEV